MHSQPGQPRRGGGRRVAAERPEPPPPPSVPDDRADLLREYLQTAQLRAQRATSWLKSSSHYARLLNRDGVVPVTVRFTAADLEFLGQAREELLRFTDLGLRLAELHQPLDDTALTSDPASQFPRCRSCMWRWPCPTFRILDEVLAEGLEPT
jgi:hypothetical protein